MSLLLTRFAKAASLLVLLAACGANDAGSGNKGPRGNGSLDDGTGEPSDEPGTGDDGGFIDDHLDDAGPGVEPDAACATTSMESKALPPAVLFQLDLSGSMQCRPTEPGSCETSAGNESRWHILREALKEALDSIPAGTLVGVMHYPTPALNPFGCQTASVVDAQVKLLDDAHKAMIRTQLDGLVPSGGTPTHQAMVDAYVELQKYQANKFIVLATDGEANYCVGCNPFCLDPNADNQQMIQSVGEVFQKENVRTFVIGVPGSGNFRSVLSAMAKAGGTGKPGCGATDCHFDMTTTPENFGEAIAQVLGEISQQLLGCIYSIPEQDGSFDPGQVNVRFTEGGVESDIPRDPSRQDGWDYTADGKQIELFGPTCDKVKASQQGRIDILFGCPTVVR